MDFEYLATNTFTGLLEIEDVGNCAITAFNDIGWESILIIDTQLGKTRVLQMGPIAVDLERLPDIVSCTLTQLDFSQKKLCGIINTFLNNNKTNRFITQAMEVSKEKALEDCRNLIEYMSKPIY